MKAICIRQPYAQFVIAGIKEGDNRSWPTMYRGPLLIVASRTLERGAMAHYSRTDWGAYVLDLIALGGIIGVVQMVDCLDPTVRRPKDSWREPNCYYHLYAKPRVFEEPIPFKGKLRLFDVPDKLVAEQLRRARAFRW